MNIQSTNAMGYIKTLKNKEPESQNISQLFLDDENKKSGKPRLEVRTEGGYIRKYIVKANGDKILIMETKQKENPDGTVENESGDLIDMAHDLLMKQLEESPNPQMQESKVIATWEKESGLKKYKTGI